MAVKSLREFIKLESSGGIVLFLAAIVALIVDNTNLHPYYHALFSLTLSLKLGSFELSKPLLLWINDGLMSIFFLLVGLEIKREFFEGELSSVKKASLPAMAALGGMVIPALFYWYCNHGDPYALRGWAIPTATDIAFSLGILALLRSRIPVSLKIFLTALAIFDDIGAIIVIAVFYTQHISLVLLVVSLLLILLLLLFNRFNITHYAPYFIVGLVLWVCVLKSGVHATLAGIILALVIPLRDEENPQRSPLRDLEHRLHPWVAFGVLPIFAFANAGVSLSGFSWSSLLSPVQLGIAGGLFLGKQIGVWLFSWLAIRTGFAEMPEGANFAGIYGIGLIAGVGFTMSLFIGGLAFGHHNVEYSAYVRVGVLAGSVLSGLAGYFVLRFTHMRPDRLAAQK